MKTKDQAIPVEKNKIYKIKIEDIGSEGQGIGRINGFAVFIPEVLPGEVCEVLIVKVNKNFAYGKALKILEFSENRAEPFCPIYKRCGGCSFQHMKYEAQLDFKTKRVKDALERIGGFKNIDVHHCVGMASPYNYRNKAQFPVGRKDDKAIIGFYAKRSHDIVDCESCKIQHNVCDEIIKAVRDFIDMFSISVYDEKTNKGLIRHVLTRVGFTTGEIMVCIVANGEKIPHKEILIERLREIDGMKSIVLNINRNKTNVILSNDIRLLWGNDKITDYIGDLKFEISALSFFQVNPVQTKVLYEMAVEAAGLTGEENVLDIYCGIGTISLFMAKKAKKVLGIEIIPEAIEDAKRNAKLNDIRNAEFKVGSAKSIIPVIFEEGFSADVVVVDPPRKGCEKEVLETIVKMSPKKVVYVSCESSTLARDLKYLGENGYEVGKVEMVDQFCHTVHVETVVSLSHKNADTHINVNVEFGDEEGQIPIDEIARKAEEYRPSERVTYKIIQEYIENKYNFKVHTAYIAEVKRDLGLPMYDAPNAVEELKQERKHPTPEKIEAIKDALKYFEVIK